MAELFSIQVIGFSRDLLFSYVFTFFSNMLDRIAMIGIESAVSGIKTQTQPI